MAQKVVLDHEEERALTTRIQRGKEAGDVGHVLLIFEGSEGFLVAGFR